MSILSNAASLSLLSFAFDAIKGCNFAVKYFSESLQGEFEGQENVLDWCTSQSWIGNPGSTSAISIFQRQTVKPSFAGEKIVSAFTGLDSILAGLIQSLDLTVAGPISSSKPDAIAAAKDHKHISAARQLFNLLGCLRVGTHSVYNASVQGLVKVAEFAYPAAVTAALRKLADHIASSVAVETRTVSVSQPGPKDLQLGGRCWTCVST